MNDTDNSQIPNNTAQAEKPSLSFKIGRHTIDKPVILAPMAGVTDRPFRQLCKDLGAGLAVSEMVGANSLIHGSEKTERRANHIGETRPVSVQIVGACPKMMGEAAKINQDKGAEIIDINMGCPAKKICNTLSGSALLKDEPLVQRILHSVVTSVDIPVTLKIRTGWDKDNRNGVKVAQIAESEGIQALAVHGRTRNCMFKGEAEYETIRQIKQAVDIPVIANGDITSPEKALEVFAKTNVDAVMIGRAAQGRPWIFNEIYHYLTTNQRLSTPTAATIKQIMLNHLENLYEFYGGDRGTFIARKHVSWYSKGQRESSHFRKLFNALPDPERQLQAITEYFDQLIEKDKISH